MLCLDSNLQIQQEKEVSTNHFYLDDTYEFNFDN